MLRISQIPDPEFLIQITSFIPLNREVQLDLTPEIEVFHMLFDRCHTKNRKRSIKQRIYNTSNSGVKFSCTTLYIPWLRVYGVCLGCALEELDLREHLELLAPLVEVDESLVGDGVRDGRVDHGQVSQEGTQVRDRAVAYGLKKHHSMNFSYRVVHPLG